MCRFFYSKAKVVVRVLTRSAGSDSGRVWLDLIKGVLLKCD